MTHGLRTSTLATAFSLFFACYTHAFQIDPPPGWTPRQPEQPGIFLIFAAPVAAGEFVPNLTVVKESPRPGWSKLNTVKAVGDYSVRLQARMLPLFKVLE